VPDLLRGALPLREGGLLVRFGFLNLAPAPMPSRLTLGLAIRNAALSVIAARAPLADLDYAGDARAGPYARQSLGHMISATGHDAG
jgi:hypothetical protein